MEKISSSPTIVLTNHFQNHHKKGITGFLTLILLLFFIPCRDTGCASAADENLEPLNRFPRMVQEYFVNQVRQISHERDQRIDSLTSQEDALIYIEDVRQKIQNCLGPWPDKTPLNARTIATIERSDYKIEKIIFESRPQFLVTANLYIPKNKKFPLPGVIGTCGHATKAKASKPYQSYAQGLAKLGYAVLIFDPAGQGERLQYPDEHLNSKVGPPVAEHMHAGNQQFLVGESFASWMVWDGIRALDYLLTRQEVDPDRVGVTGNSGGGTITTWLCGVERRFQMSAPSCFVTTFLRNLENELAADTEQCPAGALAFGLEQADFLAAFAPKPVRLLAKEKDFFDVRGTINAYQELNKLYWLLNAQTNVDLFIGSGTHGYSKDNREAMYKWFNTHTGISNAREEPALQLEKEKTLWCAPKGQVCTLDSKPIYEFTREKSKMLARERQKNLSQKELKKYIRSLLSLDHYEKYRKENPVPEYRILRNRRGRKYPKPYAATYLISTEPGIQAVVYRLSDDYLNCRPPRTGKKAILYISHHSSDAELRNEPVLENLIAQNPNVPFYTCDVRGIGESRPDTCNQDSFLDYYGSDYFYAIHSIMLNRPYVGQKTYDIIRVLDWLKSAGHEDIHLVAKGWGTIPAAFAAVLNEQIDKVTLINALTSFSDIAEAQTYNWPLSCFVPEILKFFDMPDCYRFLSANKHLRQISPWDQNAEHGAREEK